MMSSGVTMDKAVTILGAGTQGRRLALMWSSKGQAVHLLDLDPAQLSASLTEIAAWKEENLFSGAVHGEVKTAGLEELERCLRASWLVVECVPEKLELKKRIIQQLDDLAPEDVIVASNSSSYTCGDILKGLTLKKESRFLSAHSYWPPETRAIEIMGHKTTDDKYIKTMLAQCEAHHFEAFHVKVPSTGYIYNRIWAAIKRESLLALSEKVATPAEIDAIFRSVLQTPQGPFQLMDKVGLDVVLDIEQHYADERGNLPEEPREVLRGMIGEGRMGRKTGKGFYGYDDRGNEIEEAGEKE